MIPDTDTEAERQAQILVEAAYWAQAELASFGQDRIDRICEAMSGAALRDAARLGKMAVKETGYGVPGDKEEKNRFAAEDVWNHFRDLRTVGIISEAKNLVEILSPRGVVVGIIPSTNPTSTTIYKALISVKSRNALVLSPHHSAIDCTNETARILREAAVEEGLPENAIGCMTATTRDSTKVLMRHEKTAMILATGGTGLVRTAYASGKPAFGVGPGNVPVFVDRTADVEKAVHDIIAGKCFDNGTICSSEQSVVVDALIGGAVREKFQRQGGYFLSPSEIRRLSMVVAAPRGTELNPAIVGKSAETIARMAHIWVPSGTRCLIAELSGVGPDFPLSKEKLSPILAFYVEDGTERAAARCLEVLAYGGMGHTAGIHTRSREVAVAFGELMPVSRVTINTPTTHGAIGLSTELTPSLTLGCGSWGGNATSDNISPLHLMNIKRVAFEVKPAEETRLNSAPKSEKRCAISGTRRRIGALLFAALVSVVMTFAASAAFASDEYVSTQSSSRVQ
jgi:acetaldehyde dehydrogenase (acetylating)